MIIYRIANPANGKVYIGQTVLSLKHRWCQHISTSRAGSNSYLHKAIRKNGEQAFDVCEIAKAQNLKELHAMEVHYIWLFNSQNPKLGYNGTAGGDRQNFSDEVRRRISATLKGHSVSQETREKLRKSCSGKSRKHTTESRLKMSAARMGMKFSDEHRKNLSLSHKGKVPWNKGQNRAA